MAEITLSQTQIEDSTDLLGGAAEQAFTPSEMASGLYVPDQTTVPKPNFADFAYQLQAYTEITGSAPERQNGRIAIRPAQAPALANYEGMRGFGNIAVADSSGQRRILTAPAIVLPGGSQAALLTAEPASDTITETQHALLEAEFVKHQARVSAEHQAADVTNAGDIAPSLVIASSLPGSNAHNDLHGLAGNGKQSTFGTSFSKANRQDIQVGHSIRYVRSTVVPLNKIVMCIGERDQLPSRAQLFNTALSSGELAVSMTLAATQSRVGGPAAKQVARLQQNFHTMTNA
jgi:hypothetical protein